VVRVCFAHQAVTLSEQNATWQWAAVFVMLPIGFFFFAFGLKICVSFLFVVFFAPIRNLGRNSEFFSAISTPIMPGRTRPPVVIQV
jgi:hypothetical protein